MLAPRRVGKTSLMHELRDSPADGWIVFYSDLEAAKDAGDCIADMVAQLAKHPDTRTWLDRTLNIVPFRESIASALKNVSALVIQKVRVELKGAMAGDWITTAKQLQERLRLLPDGTRILFVHDELPYLILTMLKNEHGPGEVKEFLAYLRNFRLDPELKGKVCFLVGGSIGLNTVLRDHNLSTHINDFSLFSVEPWTPDVASAFLISLGDEEKFVLNRDSIEQILNILGEAVPYHIQLMFQAVRELCQGDANRVNYQVIERAFSQRLAGPYLDHYAQRLENVLTPADLDLARGILKLTCQSEQDVKRTELDKLASAGDSQLIRMIQLLMEDGYLGEDGDTLKFRSNLVREFWQRTQASAS